MDAGNVAAGAPRGVEAGRGVTWWSDAWALFTKNVAMWVVLSLLMLVIYIVLSVIPFVGAVAATLLAPAFIGSWMLAARKLENGGTLEVGDLFLAFKDRLTPLVVIGALLFAATLVIGLVIGILGFGAIGGLWAGAAQHSRGGMMMAAGTGMLALLIGLLLGFVVALAVWFAPALVVFQGTPPIDALKASVAASLKNVGPFLIYGLLYIVAAIVASIPLGLGWLVLVPIVMLTVYVSYKDIFGPPPAA
ncbi:MAG: hypothetical protein KF788_22870 [Piscinibacter sp.]|nr:hypothetical protein [Piscinibacter sp.]